MNGHKRSNEAEPRVVIVGGGFAGLYCARSLRSAAVTVTLIDRRNFHLFQPLLYQVATGGLSPANIAAPLRAVLRRQRNCRVLLGEVTGFDLERRRVHIGGAPDVEYDTLVVATGVRHTYFGHDEWEQHAPGLKSIEDATRMRARILSAFEAAELESDPQRKQAWLTFVVVGGGPTGVELAGALGEIARKTLRGDFRSVNPAEARILLVEGAERVLTAYPPELSAYAQGALERLGVTVLTRSIVKDVQPEHVVIHRQGADERVPCRVVLWAAGIAASPLGTALARAAGTETDRAGRVIVSPELTLPGRPEVFVIGDLAHVKTERGPLPGVAPVAMQQGAYVAKMIAARLNGAALPAFSYADPGSMATIGRAAAVADFGPRLRFTGYLAWLLWLFVHIVNLIQFEHRLLVLMQWAWNYLTWGRTARLITESGDRAGERARESKPEPR